MALNILPPVHEILKDPHLRDTAREIEDACLKRLVQGAIARFRKKLRSEPRSWRNREAVKAAIVSDVGGEVWELLTPFPSRVINGTGVIVHTNLGRAPLGDVLSQIDVAALSRYSNLEWDARTQKRGSRDEPIAALLRVLTGAEAAVAVNNCASALLLALNTVGGGKDVLVSRSELVEIGGGFRIPEIMEASGCRLVEVGTTNKTRIGDYEKKASAGKSVLLKVHQSNFVQRGFVESVPLAELAQLGRKLRIPVIHDNGSGLLTPSGLPFLDSEPTVTQSLKDGAAIVVFSADKLLGSVQAGVALGKSSLIDAMRRNPLYRAVRLDKVRMALLRHALGEYLQGRSQNLPVWKLITATGLEHLEKRLRLPAQGARWVKLKAQTGGGSNPESSIDSWGLELAHRNYSPQQLKEKFALRPVPILGYIQGSTFRLDVRTFFDDDFEEVQRALDELW
jgi:L-seryl-tRNA(Ser) seleniumtransferase